MANNPSGYARAIGLGGNYISFNDDGTVELGGAVADQAPFKYADNTQLKFGTGNDITIAWDGTDLDILQATANSSIKFGVSGAGIDLVLYGDTAGRNLTWDQSADSLLFEDSTLLVFGTGSDVTVRWDGTDLDILGVADDQVIKVGNGTNSFDVWVYGNTASDYVLWDASANKLSFVAGAFVDLGGTVGHYRHTPRAASGNISPTILDSGSVYLASAACEVTLPAVATSAGFYLKIITAVDENLKITAPSGKLVTFNNATATSVSYEQTGEQIGNGFEVYCDGSFYYAVILAQETSTVTVA